jgi:hypothetical protein
VATVSDIQRWTHYDERCDHDPAGEWVTYADHLAAVAAATEEAVRDYAEAHYANGVKRYRDGQRDERARIRAAVEAEMRACGIHEQRIAAVLAVIDGKDN